MSTQDHGKDRADRILNWLIAEARQLGDGVAIVEGYVERLVACGVPLSRVRVAQQLANPLLSAWGVLWTPEKTADYTVRRAMLATGSWYGSPFEYVINNRTPLRKRLGTVTDEDHIVYREIAAAGGTDFYATVLEYGDGSVQACSFVSDAPAGFSDEHLQLIEGLRHGLACAMEPVAMRRSSESLLRTYLGDGPAGAVAEGSIRRGELSHIYAVVMFSDLRDFTRKSAQWSEAELLGALDIYFETVVDAVHRNGGDVLKFMGDGVLSVFPLADSGGHNSRAADALRAAEQISTGMGDPGAATIPGRLRVGTGINFGQVTYGNIGSPDRLDFTVIGPAVNLASRIQDLCKPLDEKILVTEAIAQSDPARFRSKGKHRVAGLDEPVEVFAPLDVAIEVLR